MTDLTPKYLEIPDTFVFIFERTFFLFSAITVPFYIFILYVLVQAQLSKNPNLSNPFFKLCISSGIIDIVNILNNYIFSVFPRWGLFRSFYLFLGLSYVHFYFFIAWSAGVCQALAVSVLATNRLSAILYPEKYAKMWYGNRLKMAILIQFAPGMLLSSATLFNEVILKDNNNGGLVSQIASNRHNGHQIQVDTSSDMRGTMAFNLKLITATFFFLCSTSSPKATTLYFSVGGFFLGGNSLYLIIAYAFLLKTLHKRHKSQQGVKREEDENTIQSIAKRRERRLFIMSLCIVIVQLIILSFFSLKVVAVVRLTLEQFYMFYNALSDVYSGVNPYLLWIFSDVLRDHIYKLLKIKKKKKKQHLVVSVSVRPDRRTLTPISKYRTNRE